MKVALISHLYPTKRFPHQGKFIQDHFELLNEQSDIEVELIVPTPYSIPFTKRWDANRSELMGNDRQYKRVHYLSFPKRQFPKIIQKSLSKNLTNFLVSKGYDLVHIHWAYPDALAIPAIKAAGIKTVLTIHGSDWYQTTNTPVLSNLIKNSLVSSDRVLYSGAQLKQDAGLKFPKLSEKSDIIYNMVDTDSYKPVSTSQKTILKNQLNWDPSKKHALTVANIRHEKGIDLLIKTIAQNKELATIQFHLIGNPEDSDFSRQVLHDIDNNPHNNIELLPSVKPSELIKFYQASDFYILPSRNEGFNVSILEAASCGLSLVCTDVGGNKEVISKGTGIIMSGLEDGNFSDILEMVNTYSEYSPTEMHQIIEDHYGKSIFLDRLLQSYTLVLNS